MDCHRLLQAKTQSLCTLWSCNTTPWTSSWSGCGSWNKFQPRPSAAQRRIQHSLNFIKHCKSDLMDGTLFLCQELSSHLHWESPSRWLPAASSVTRGRWANSISSIHFCWRRLRWPLPAEDGLHKKIGQVQGLLLPVHLPVKPGCPSGGVHVSGDGGIPGSLSEVLRQERDSTFGLL